MKQSLKLQGIKKMALYIEIKKVNFANSIHYYHAMTETAHGPLAFFIGIENHKKLLHVHKDNINKIPDFSIDLERPYIDENMQDKVFQNMLVRVLVKAMKAYRDNNYPEYISFEA